MRPVNQRAPVCELLLEMKPLKLLTGHVRDDVEVPVAVENREASQLGGRRDQEIGHSRSRA